MDRAAQDAAPPSPPTHPFGVEEDAVVALDDEEEEEVIDVGSPLYFKATAEDAESVDDDTGVTPLADAEAEGGQVHLVEGDFFPEAAPEKSEDADEEETAGVDEEDEEDIADLDAEGAAATPQRRLSSTGTPSVPPSPSALPTRKAQPVKRRRVTWPEQLIHRVNIFHIPSQSPSTASRAFRTFDSTGGDMSPTSSGSPTSWTSGSAMPPPPPSIFREKQNSDKTVYKSCKAQRPSVRFSEWKRQVQTPGTALREPPLALQPQPPKPVARQTLFAALYRRPPRRIVTGPVHCVTRVASNAAPAARCPQLPYIDKGAMTNAPQPLPLLERTTDTSGERSANRSPL